MGAKDRPVPALRLYRRLRLYVERGRPKDAVSSRAFLSHRAPRTEAWHEAESPTSGTV